MSDINDQAPPPDPQILHVTEILVTRLSEYLEAYPPAHPSPEQRTNLSQKSLRSYVYSGAVFVLVDPFIAWYIDRYGIANELAHFSEAILFAGGRNGDVVSSAEGETVHVWRLPTHGLYTMTDAFVRGRTLH